MEGQWEGIEKFKGNSWINEKYFRKHEGWSYICCNNVVKVDILGHLDEVAKVNNEVKDEVKRAVENLSGDIEYLEGIVNNKIKAAEKHRTNQWWVLWQEIGDSDKNFYSALV